MATCFYCCCLWKIVIFFRLRAWGVWAAQGLEYMYKWDNFVNAKNAEAFGGPRVTNWSDFIYHDLFIFVYLFIHLCVFFPYLCIYLYLYICLLT